MSKYCPYKNSNVVYLECNECDAKICDDNWFFCIVAGSRTFNDYSALKKYMDFVLSSKSNVVIISGGAKGADTLAERYAEERGFISIVMKADWDKHGKSAGFIRNREMHKVASHSQSRGCVAFWDGQSKGTADNFKLCKEFNTPLKIFRFN